MINVLYCGNAGVFDGVLTSALSIVKRMETPRPIKLYIFTMDLSDLDKKYTPLKQSHQFRGCSIVVIYKVGNRNVKERR